MVLINCIVLVGVKKQS